MSLLARWAARDAVPESTLMLGDCFDRMREIPDGSVDMVLCDLPYGTTQNKWDTVLPLERLWAEYWRVCRGAVVLTAAQPFTCILGASNKETLAYSWVWEKSRPTNHLNAKKQPLRLHEDILIFYKKQPTYNPQGLISCQKIRKARSTNGTNYGAAQVNASVDFENYPTSVLLCPSEDNRGKHPTQKPVELMDYFIRTYTNFGDMVLDNTMGSGTTGVACANSGRRFVGIERDEGYFAIAERRIRDAERAARERGGVISYDHDQTEGTAREGSRRK